jgi:hypothetical protein
LIRRVLVVAPDLGELTSFANALAELGARGCHVHLAVEHDPPPGVDISVFAGRFRRLTVGPAPGVGSAAVLGLTIRAVLDCWRFLSSKTGPDRAAYERALAQTPSLAAGIARNGVLRSRLVRPLAARILAAIEPLLPPSSEVADFLRAFNPELLVVTPLFAVGSTAPDYLRAARALRIATFGMPTRWDDLTMGAMLHVVPDCIALWNRDERRRAIEQAGVQARRTAVIGVPLPLDILGPIKTTRETFCARHGMDAAKSIVLFAPHGEEARRLDSFSTWIASVRSNPDRRVRESQVLVHWPPPGSVRQREHPDIQGAVVVPRADSDSTWYRFDVAEAVHHADAVVTTDMTLVLEAATRARRVLALLWPHGGDAELSRFCADSDLRGEWLLPAGNVHDHLTQLARVLDVGISVEHGIAIRSRLRPHGPDLSPGFLMAARLFQEVVDRRADAPRPRAWRLRRALLAPIAAIAAWCASGLPVRRVPGARARILVAVPGAEALFLHQPLLRALVERGHRVQVLFTARRSQTADVYARIRCDVPGLSPVGVLTPLEGLWGSIARGLLGISAFAAMLEGRQQKPAPRWLARYAFAVLPAGARRGAWLARIGRETPRRLRRVVSFLDRGVAPSRLAREWLQREKPDVVLVLPEPDLVSGFDSAESQADLVRAASALGIQAVAIATSADAHVHATMLHPGPSHVLVWNDEQKRAVSRVSRLTSDRVLVTGAALLDGGLDQSCLVDAAEFRRMLGLPPEGPFALFVGSPGPLNDPDAEIELVRRWVENLRRHDDPALRGLAVLVRPAASRAGRWQHVDLSHLGGVVLGPQSYDRAGELNMVLLAESVRYAAVTVGIDGLSLLLAAALDRPAVAVTSTKTDVTPSSAVPLDFLWNGAGSTVRYAASTAELTAHVRASLGASSTSAAPATSIASLVRPRQDRRPSEITADHIEELARHGGRRQRSRTSILALAIRVPLILSAAVVAALAWFERPK